jgi:hypothetical protein
MTTELWVRFHSLPTAGNRMTLTAKWLQSGVAPNNRSWSLFIFNDGGTLKLEFSANDLGTSVANAVVSWPWTPIVGTWYHVAHTYDISQVQSAESVAYINGVDQGAATIEVARNISGIYDGIARFGVGSWDHAQQGGLLAADISNVRLWSVTRTQGEIQGYLYQFLTGSETGLVEDWRLANDYTSNASGGTTLISVGPPSFITEVPF